MSTSIPASLDYPIKDLDRGWQMVKGVIELGYAQGWRRLGGLWKVMLNN